MSYKKLLHVKVLVKRARKQANKRTKSVNSELNYIFKFYINDALKKKCANVK
jgi:hypothetical protein